MSYSMEHLEEAERLTRQNQQENYNILNEVRYFNFSKNDLVLDAGCGSGDVHITLAQNFKNIKIDAFDFSEIRLKQAENKCKQLGINTVNYFQSDIYKINATSEKYDKVICRFVLEHLDKPIEAMKELQRVLKKGGHLYIIDLDGILFNIESESKKLNTYLARLKENFTFDLFIGRKLPNYLRKIGFTKINTNIDCMNFANEQMTAEITNYVDRFNFAKTKFVQALGSENDYEKFAELYIKELKNGCTLFYNKFLVDAVK